MGRGLMCRNNAAADYSVTPAPRPATTRPFSSPERSSHRRARRAYSNPYSNGPRMKANLSGRLQTSQAADLRKQGSGGLGRRPECDWGSTGHSGLSVRQGNRRSKAGPPRTVRTSDSPVICGHAAPRDARRRETVRLVVPSRAAVSRMDVPRALRRRMTSCCSTGVRSS